MPTRKTSRRLGDELFWRPAAVLDRVAPLRNNPQRTYPGIEIFGLMRAGELTADEIDMIRAVHEGRATHPALSNAFIVMLLAWKLDRPAVES